MAEKKQILSTGREARFVNTLILLVAIVIGIIMVNLISTYVSGRLDLTESSVNSLSPQSVEVLQSLTGVEGASPLEVRLYVSKNLPATIKGDWGQDVMLRGVDQKLRDKLEEYRAEVEGMMEIVDVTQDVEKKAEDAGLQPFVAEEATVKEGKLEMTQYVLGATFHYEGAVEVFPKALDPNFFEFEITKILLRLKDKVENAQKIQHLIAASDALADAIKDCTIEVTAYEPPKEKEEEEVSGIEGLLKPIENMEEEAGALAKNRDRIAEKCSPVTQLIESKGLPLKGQHKRFDTFLSGAAPDGRKGGVEAFVQILGELAGALDAEQPDVQKVMELKGLLVALKDDAVEFSEMLKRAPGQRKIGFVCGHGEFCPFASDQPVIDPKIAQMMGQQNPIHERFIGAALQIQDQVNQILASIGNGLFTDKDFDVMKVVLDEPVPEEVSALVLFAPREKYTDRDKYEIDQFLLRGGTVLVFAESFDLTLGGFSEEEVRKQGPFNPQMKISNDNYLIAGTSSNVDELLAPYGITLNKDLVIDPLNNNKVTLPHSVRRGRLMIRGSKDFDYPLLVHAKEFDREAAMVRNLPGLTLPFASSLEYAPVEGNELEVSHLVKSSNAAISVVDPTSVPVIQSEAGAENLKLLPPELADQAGKLTPNGPHTLALMATGTFKSAFTGKEAPPKPEKKKKPEEEGMPDLPEKEKKEPPRLDSGEGRLLVVGSGMGIKPLTLEGVFKDVGIQQLTQGEFLIPQVRLENWKISLNQLRRVFGETIPMLFNMLDWAVQRAALAEIRAKNYAWRPIENVEEGSQRLVTYAAVGGLPVLFILFGVGYWQVRVMRRRNLSRSVKASAGQAAQGESKA